jgi:hypothetical protein
MVSDLKATVSPRPATRRNPGSEGKQLAQVPFLLAALAQNAALGKHGFGSLGAGHY